MDTTDGLEFTGNFIVHKSRETLRIFTHQNYKWSQIYMKEEFKHPLRVQRIGNTGAINLLYFA